MEQQTQKTGTRVIPKEIPLIILILLFIIGSFLIMSFFSKLYIGFI